MTTVDLAALTADHFTPLSGQTFLMTDAGGERAAMELWKVRAAGHRVPRGFRQQFALEFKSPSGALYPQGTYRMEHEALGVMDLFITPIQAAGGGCNYEAVFG